MGTATTTSTARITTWKRACGFGSGGRLTLLGRYLSTLCLGVCLGGCADEERAEVPEPAAETRGAPSDVDVPPPPHMHELFESPLPAQHGLFLVEDQDRLVAIDPGQPEWFHPTNAERGFGFLCPWGPTIADAQPLFVLWTGALELSTLRLTRFAPEALLPARWWEASTPGRSAWLPRGIMRVTVEPVDGTPGMVRVRPVDPLSPGFYALHDGSLIRGARREEVGAYYPLQVVPEKKAGSAPESPEAAWLAPSTTCIEDLVQQVVDAHVIETRAGATRALFDRSSFARSQAARLRHCGEELHAVMMATTMEAIRSTARANLVALQTIASGPDWTSIPVLVEATQATDAAAALTTYWLELESIALALEARRAIAANDKAAASAAAAKLAALYLAPGAGRSSSLSQLLWVPYFVDGEWARLEGLTARLAANLDPYEELFLLIAAHRAARLDRFAQLFPESALTTVVGHVAASQPMVLREARAGLDLNRGSNTSIQFGSAYVEPPDADPSVMGAVERWLRGRRKAIDRCYERYNKQAGNARSGLVLVRVRLTTTIVGSTASLTVEVPGSGDTAAFGDASLVQCLEDDALSGLPIHALPVDATLTMPVVFYSGRNLGSTIR